MVTLEPHGKAGDAPTRLVNKLGIKETMRVALLDAPVGFSEFLDPLPEGVTIRGSLWPRGQTQLAVAFVTQRDRLEKRLGSVLRALPEDGILWVAWPKRSAKLASDLSDRVVRQVVLPSGWVDTKVCAIDATWSGLRFTLRRALRSPAR